ncbi:MAG: Ig-like domain-containing protein [Firmicutes bacterium]|nr:Ig-like domain-containing protein [Bacillota bacterium]
MKSNTVTVNVIEALAKLELTESKTTIDVDSTDVFTVKALDIKNNPMANIEVALYEDNNKIDTGTTNSNGEVSFTIKFNKKGTYNLYAVST